MIIGYLDHNGMTPITYNGLRYQVGMFTHLSKNLDADIEIVAMKGCSKAWVIENPEHDFNWIKNAIAPRSLKVVTPKTSSTLDYLILSIVANCSENRAIEVIEYVERNYPTTKLVYYDTDGELGSHQIVMGAETSSLMRVLVKYPGRFKVFESNLQFVMTNHQGYADQELTPRGIINFVVPTLYPKVEKPVIGFKSYDIGNVFTRSTRWQDVLEMIPDAHILFISDAKAKWLKNRRKNVYLKQFMINDLRDVISESKCFFSSSIPYKGLYTFKLFEALYAGTLPLIEIESLPEGHGFPEELLVDKMYTELPRVLARIINMDAHEYQEIFDRSWSVMEGMMAINHVSVNWATLLHKFRQWVKITT